MYGRIPILPIDVEFGVMLPDIAHVSWQYYPEKLKAHLKWAYKVAKENNDYEAARHKQYYDQKLKCIKIVPGDLILHSTGPNAMPQGYYQIQWNRRSSNGKQVPRH